MKLRATGWVYLLIGLGLCLPGCVQDPSPQLDTSPESRQILVNTIQEHAQRAQGFRAYGTSVHGFVDSDGKTRTLPPFGCTLFFKPPECIHLISKATATGSIYLGCNKESFWMAIKPEINTYYWGRWDQAIQEGVLPINPKVVLEAIGLIDLGDTERWVLEEEGDALVLTRPYPEKRIIKKVYVDKKRLRIERIMYMNTEHVPLVVADLAGHRAIAKDFAVPTITRVTAFEQGERVGWVTIKLKDFRLADLKDKLFKRPPDRSYEQVIEVTKDKPQF